MAERERVIYKYNIPIDDEWHALPGGSVIHTEVFDSQQTVTVWIDQYTEAPDQFFYRAFPTGGNPGPMDEHVGTAIYEGAGLVWHVYRQGLAFGQPGSVESE